MIFQMNCLKPVFLGFLSNQEDADILHQITLSDRTPEPDNMRYEVSESVRETNVDTKKDFSKPEAAAHIALLRNENYSEPLIGSPWLFSLYRGFCNTSLNGTCVRVDQLPILGMIIPPLLPKSFLNGYTNPYYKVYESIPTIVKQCKFKTLAHTHTHVFKP